MEEAVVVDVMGNNERSEDSGVIKAKRHCSNARCGRNRWMDYHFALLPPGDQREFPRFEDCNEHSFTSPSNTPIPIEQADQSEYDKGCDEYFLTEIFIDDAMGSLPALRNNMFRSISMDVSERADLIQLNNGKSAIEKTQSPSNAPQNYHKRKFHDAYNVSDYPME